MTVLKVLPSSQTYFYILNADPRVHPWIKQPTINWKYCNGCLYYQTQQSSGTKYSGRRGIFVHDYSTTCCTKFHNYLHPNWLLAAASGKQKEEMKKALDCYGNVSVNTHHISRNNVTVNFSPFKNQPIYYVIMNLTFERGEGRRSKRAEKFLSLFSIVTLLFIDFCSRMCHDSGYIDGWARNKW